MTNIGQVDINETDITVTDNIFGEVSTIADKADGDDILAPNETWVYLATGQALDLTNPGTPSGLQLVAGVCTQGEQEIPSSIAYTNIGIVTIPSMQTTDPSSYCGPQPTGIDGIPEPAEKAQRGFLPLNSR